MATAVSSVSMHDKWTLYTVQYSRWTMKWPRVSSHESHGSEAMITTANFEFEIRFTFSHANSMYEGRKIPKFNYECIFWYQTSFHFRCNCKSGIEFEVLLHRNSSTRSPLDCMAWNWNRLKLPPVWFNLAEFKTGGSGETKDNSVMKLKELRALMQVSLINRAICKVSCLLCKLFWFRQVKWSTTSRCKLLLGIRLVYTKSCSPSKKHNKSSSIFYQAFVILSRLDPGAKRA